MSVGAQGGIRAEWNEHKAQAEAAIENDGVCHGEQVYVTFGG